MDQPFAVSVAVQESDARGASARLHGSSSLEAGDSVCWDSVLVQLGVDHVVSIGIVSRQIEQVDSGEDNQESAQQGNGVNGIGSVESLEENKRSAERGGRKGDIVEGIDAVERSLLAGVGGNRVSSAYMEVENEFKALLK